MVFAQNIYRHLKKTLLRLLLSIKLSEKHAHIKTGIYRQAIENRDPGKIQNIYKLL